jgi:hypothetical protein
MAKSGFHHSHHAPDHLFSFKPHGKFHYGSIWDAEANGPFEPFRDHFSFDRASVFGGSWCSRPEPVAAAGTQLAVYSGNGNSIPIVEVSPAPVVSEAGSSSGTAGTGATTGGTALVASAASAGLIINVSFDASVASAPAGFTTVVNAVVNYLQSQFSDPITINIAVGYGEAGGNSLGGALGMSLTYLTNTTYSTLRGAVAADAKTADDSTALASLPSADPTGLNHYWISTAEAKALDLPIPAVPVDGYVGFSNLTNIFDFDNSNGVTAGLYDFYGVVAHEITEVMGRILLAGQTVGSTPTNYDLEDLFHYSAAGVRDFVGTQAGYFSLNGGSTKIYDFNTNPNGDFGDWAASAGNNAFLAFANPSVTLPVTASDMRVMDAIGWDLVPSSPPPAAQPDLRITGLTLSDSNISFQVQNIGAGTAAASTAGVYLSVDSTIATSDILLTTVGTPSLAANGSFNANITLPLPGSLTPGTYFIGVIADYNGQIGESSESNNASSALRVIVGNNSANVLNGTSSADAIFGLGGNDTLSGGSGNDAMNGGDGSDVFIGGAGADTIYVGPSNDNIQDVVRFGSTSEFGDIVFRFDTTGTSTQIDKVRFTGTLNTAYDDISDNNVFTWVNGNGVNGGNTTANLNATAEALFLSGANGEGVANASLRSASAVAAEFNSEFNIVASAGRDAVLVVNDTNANSFAVWQYVENGITAEIQTNELTLIGLFNANAAVVTGNFDLA